MFKDNWIKVLGLFVLVLFTSLWVERHIDVRGQDCQQPASVPACSGNNLTICSGCSINQFCCPKSNPGNCNDSYKDLCTFTTCKGSDQDMICQVIAPPKTPSTIKFINSCGTESIWIAAYNGHGGDQPLLCATSDAGKPVTGDCGCTQGGDTACKNPNPNWKGPPPWGNDGSATWEIPKGETRSLTVPFCYDSATFAARTGCTQKGDSLECTGGDCAGLINCGTNGKQPQPVTLAEFTFEGGEVKKCEGLDNYDVSAVAGFNLRVNIEPNNPDCTVAGGQCKSLDSNVCPYNQVLWNPTTNQWEIKKDTDKGIGTCLSPSNMAASPGIPPFTNFTSDEEARLGCNPAPYHISPIQPVGNCFSTFGKGGTCTLSACGLGAVFCDPYGECDKELNRTAVWPSFTDPSTMTQTSSTIYIENIQKACGNNTNGGGIYAWAFDDTPSPPGPSGLSGGLYTCPSSATPNGGQNYTVTFWCDGDKDHDGVADPLDVDSDNDGITNTDEVASNEIILRKNSGSGQREIPDDPDGDGIPNELDLDSDGDGIPDHTEGGGTNDIDRDGYADNFVDVDNDGLNDEHDEDQTANVLPLPDTDSDGIPDFLDTDSDNDGVSDTNETTGMDVDGDGFLDDSEDFNKDGLADSVDPNTGTPLEFLDSDGDGVFDHLDANDNTGQGNGGCSIAVTGVKTSMPLYLLIPLFIAIRRAWVRKRCQ